MAAVDCVWKSVIGWGCRAVNSGPKGRSSPAGRKVRSRKMVIQALRRMNFDPDKTGHHIYYSHLLGPRTMIPHSKHVKTISAQLLKKIADDIQLSLSDFVQLIDDKKSTESDYLKRRKS